jgi:alpha-L-fucosidase
MMRSKWQALVGCGLAFSLFGWQATAAPPTTGPATGVGAEGAELGAALRSAARPHGPRELAIATAAAADKPALPDGPVKPTWASVAAAYRDPDWFRDAKFGIFMHWGLYSVPAHGSEWYVRYMYGNPAFTRWHTEHFGPPDKFGYKDFIPLFTCAKFDPDAWATLFRRAGAKYVVPTAEHHDGWANWDSDLTPWCAAKMGPKRDLIGDLGAAVRRQGLKFGVSSHRLNHYDFIQPTPGLATDLFDPRYDDFYWVANHSDQRYEQFLADWVGRSVELIDKYQPDMLWYDIGGPNRDNDPVRLKVAAHYFNQAQKWGKQVALSGKGEAFLAGSIMDYEREGRAPMERTDWVWQADDPIANKFGYVEGLQPYKPGTLVDRLIENTSKNGNLLLNISPKADGTIPQDQQDVLLAIGRWLDVNGEAIYGTRPWAARYGEGPAADAAAACMAALRGAGFAGRTNEKNLGDDKVGGGGVPKHGYTPADVRFTTHGDTLYAIVMAWPGQTATIASLAAGKGPGTVGAVELLGHAGPLQFKQDGDGLKVTFPADKPCDFAYTLKVTGLKLN